VIGRRVYGRRDPAPAAGTLNRRTAGYVGRVVALDEPIANGRGRARIDGSIWLVAGPDLPAGTQVRITGSDGTVLRVEPQGTPS
jgi:membrane protein implicated in regulation of membrane protease activity